MLRLIKHIIKRVVREFRPHAAPSGRVSPEEAQINWLKARGLRVGKNLNLQHDVIIDNNHCWLIEIGDNVTIAPRVYILAHDASSKVVIGHTRIAPVRIGDRTFIGAGSIILPGSEIGHDCIIGAGSVVTRPIPPFSVVAGNPAKVICTLSEYKKRKEAEFNKTPKFGLEYSVEQNITDTQKSYMQKELNGGPGYVP